MCTNVSTTTKASFCHRNPEQKPLYIPRVNQLDAIQLNGEIYRCIKQPFLQSLQDLMSNFSLYRLQPEVELLLDTIIWHYSMCRTFPATFGQQILMMTYDKKQLTQFRLALYYCLTILTKYFRNLQERRDILRMQWLSELIVFIDNCIHILRIFNFFRFLKSGRRPSLIDYILGLDYVTLENNSPRRNIGSQSLMRELLWSAFAELLTTCSPLINSKQLKHFYQHYIQMNFRKPKPSNEDFIKRRIFSNNSLCMLCSQRPYFPQYLNCSHLYCYYCTKALYVKNNQPQCVLCCLP